ncbi:hypothetical protein FSP39_001036 [Pinctada imbricata]|uniref:Reverse transcriptase domain-containing protein n=1 Tax=Pinctada imbricata TaxID=66713 RepID=A0AA89BN66_PINIB|nr:hypothetical protein FSP39_001036 [Pinctada imbricata]
MNELQVRIRDSKPLIIGITEVKAKNMAYSLRPAELSMDWTKEYNMFHVNIENSEGRGLILYVHNSLLAVEVKMETAFEENLFIKIRTGGNDFILVGLIYRSPSDNSSEKGENLRKLLSEAASLKYAHHLIMGDFNYREIDWNLLQTRGDNSEEQKFVECLQDNYMTQCIDKPTRWRSTNTPHILDLLITKEENSIEELEHQSPLGKSDHCVIVFNYICSIVMRKSQKRRKCYRKANFLAIKREISSIDWENALKLQEGTIDDIWERFRNTMEVIENKFVPTIKVGQKKNTVPLDKETLQAIKEKNVLSRKVVRTKDESIRKKYNRVRNKVAKLVRKARKEYENSLARDAKANPKRIWQYINSKSKIRQGESDLCIDPGNPKSTKSDDDCIKANILAKFFSNVFTKEPHENIPELAKRPIEKEWTGIEISEELISKVMRNLKPDKSPGMDNMHPMFLRELHLELAHPLALIFKRSLELRRVPNDWKKARISAIFKKGNKSLAGNYRPVSLTSIICKIMEKLVRDHLVEHFTKNSYFTSKQYGFMAGRSTALQLIRVMDEWTSALDCGYGIDCIYMDYQKAFDTVPHKRLLKKLEAYNIGPETIEWIGDYLSDRKQQVSVNGEVSEWHEVTSGIPQGSVLGPTMFVIFINDLPDIVKSTVYLFADDTKIFNLVQEVEDKNTLQRDLEQLTTWSNTWLLRFHPQKCKHLHIGKRDPDPEFHYSLLGNTLEQVKEEKDIGVIIDEKLSFDQHISEKVKKANSMFGVIRRIFQHFDDKSFIPIYKALVRTHLEYASSVWSPYKVKHIEMVEGVQRRATKQIPGYADLTYEERLRKLKLPTLKYRRYHGDMIEMYKIISGKYDPAAANFIKLRSDHVSRDCGRGNSKTLFVQRPRLDIRKHNFSIRSTNIWNSLPDDVVCAKSLNSFKNKLDKFWRNQEVLYDYKADIRTGSRVNNSKESESSKEDPIGTCVGNYP